MKEDEKRGRGEERKGKRGIVKRGRRGTGVREGEVGWDNKLTTATFKVFRRGRGSGRGKRGG